MGVETGMASQREPEIAQQMKLLEATIARMTEKADGLNARLSSVMSALPPLNSKEEAHKELCPLAMWMKENHETLCKIEQMLESILNRIELG